MASWITSATRGASRCVCGSAWRSGCRTSFGVCGPCRACANGHYPSEGCGQFFQRARVRVRRDAGARSPRSRAGARRSGSSDARGCVARRQLESSGGSRRSRCRSIKRCRRDAARARQRGRRAADLSVLCQRACPEYSTSALRALRDRLPHGKGSESRSRSCGRGEERGLPDADASSDELPSYRASKERLRL